MERQINCVVDCAKGCILGDKCPHLEHVAHVSEFIKETPLSKMLEIAEAARLKKLTQPPQWVIPDDF